MTVLLIDASGHTREMEIPDWRPVIYIPLPRPMSCRFDPGPPVYKPPLIAEFIYSDEPSYPPVYRQKLPT